MIPRGMAGRKRTKKLPKRLSFSNRTQRVHYTVAEAQEGPGYVVLQYAKRPSKYPFSHIVKHFKTKPQAKQWLKINK